MTIFLNEARSRSRESKVSKNVIGNIQLFYAQLEGVVWDENAVRDATEQLRGIPVPSAFAESSRTFRGVNRTFTHPTEKDGYEIYMGMEQLSHATQVANRVGARFNLDPTMPLAVIHLAYINEQGEQTGYWQTYSIKHAGQIARMDATDQNWQNIPLWESMHAIEQLSEAMYGVMR